MGVANLGELSGVRHTFPARNIGRVRLDGSRQIEATQRFRGSSRENVCKPPPSYVSPNLFLDCKDAEPETRRLLLQAVSEGLTLRHARLRLDLNERHQQSIA